MRYQAVSSQRKKQRTRKRRIRKTEIKKRTILHPRKNRLYLLYTNTNKKTIYNETTKNWKFVFLEYCIE